MADGREYEIFVQRLQQALLDSEVLLNQKNIEIERNKKIIDNCDIKREFDLYWEYELAGVTYKTVIECKDYASPVSVEKIDALIGKIRDIPDLKPIFATKTGYQSGAEKKASKNKIDLLIVREQRDDDWEDKEGNPLIREVNIQLKIHSSPVITSFNPLIDGNWVKENTGLEVNSNITAFELNNEVFIDDIGKGEKYSLYDLAQKLPMPVDGKYGEHEYSEVFSDAYLLINGMKLKMNSYNLTYNCNKPHQSDINIDMSKELVGVIEYLSKGSSTAIFRDKIVKDWK